MKVHLFMCNCHNQLVIDLFSSSEVESSPLIQSSFDDRPDRTLAYAIGFAVCGVVALLTVLLVIFVVRCLYTC